LFISRGIASRLIELDVSVNGDPLTRYRCDGLIVKLADWLQPPIHSPPVAPWYSNAEVFALTPICPTRCLIAP